MPFFLQNFDRPKVASVIHMFLDGGISDKLAVRADQSGTLNSRSSVGPHGMQKKKRWQFF